MQVQTAEAYRNPSSLRASRIPLQRRLDDWSLIDSTASLLCLSVVSTSWLFTWPPTPSPRFHWGTTSYLLLDTYVIRNTQNDGTILDVLTVCMNTQICTLVYMIPTIPSLQIGAACCLASIYLSSLPPSVHPFGRSAINLLIMGVECRV